MLGGYPSSWFADEPPHDFICGICHDVLNSPQQCKNGHCFCLTCVTAALKIQPDCPSCKVALKSELLASNIVVRNLIEQLPVKCGSLDTLNILTSSEIIDDTSDRVCNWTGPLTSREDHMLTCPFIVVECPLHSVDKCMPNCTGSIMRKDMTSHLLAAQEHDPNALLSLIVELRNFRGATIEGYMGEYKDGKRHGLGILKYKDSHSRYVGGWVNGKQSGYGIEYKESGVYYGQWLDGVKCGHGCNDRKGRLYVGQYERDKKHGQGVLISRKEKEGWRYEGEFNRGIMHGHGTFKWNTGSYCVGRLKNNHFNGEGERTYVNGTTFKGKLVNDKAVSGIMTYSSASVVHPCRNTAVAGVKHISDGIDTYTGDFSPNSERHGTGTYRHADGAVYEGQWFKDKQHGTGTMIYADGCIYTGVWYKNKWTEGQFRHRVEGSVFIVHEGRIQYVDLRYRSTVLASVHISTVVH